MDAALDPGLREKLRYIHAQWAHGPKWSPYDVGGDSWFGFDSVRVIEGLDVEIALIPLPGHTRGHCAVAVRDDEGWLLHCGDGYFHHGEMQTPPQAPIGVKAFQLMVEIDHGGASPTSSAYASSRPDPAPRARSACSAPTTSTSSSPSPSRRRGAPGDVVVRIYCSQ